MSFSIKGVKTIELLLDDFFLSGSPASKDVTDYLVNKERELQGPVTAPVDLALVLRLYRDQKHHELLNSVTRIRYESTHKHKAPLEDLTYRYYYHRMIRECFNDSHLVVVTESNYAKYGIAVVASAEIANRECYELEGFVDDVIMCNRYRLIPYDDESITKVLDRMDKLPEPLPTHRWYFKRLIPNMAGSSMSKELMLRILQVMPDSKLVSLVDKYGDEVLSINLNKTNELAYALGLLIYNTSGVSRETLLEKLIAIKKNPESHIRSIVAINKANLEIFRKRISSLTGEDAKVYNQKDSNGELIENYHPDKIFRYVEGGFIYQFTPPEFGKLVEEKQNFWNRNTIFRLQLEALKEIYEICQYHDEDGPSGYIPDVINECHDLKVTMREEHNLPKYATSEQEPS